MSREDRNTPERRLQVLNGLMQVAASSLDMAEIFDEVGERIKDLIDYDRLSFGFLQPGDDHLEAYAITGAGTMTSVRVPLRASSLGDAVSAETPVLIRNFPEDSPHETARRVSEELGVHSAMFVPLQARGRVTGVLIMFGFLPGSSMRTT